MTIAKESQQLLEATIRELFQAETSATRHPRVEGERLSATPPGSAMEEIALHADSQVDGLDEVARLRGISTVSAAKAIGRALSTFRDTLADLTTTSEQSYRLTMLGVRHGIDLVRMLRELALKATDEELQKWSEAWLLRRLELVEQAETELAWFAANPARAMAPARATPLAAVARTALRALS